MACARRQSRSIVGSVRDPHAPRTTAGFDRIALEARLSRLGSEAAILGHDAISVEPFVIKCPPSSRTANGCRSFGTDLVSPESRINATIEKEPDQDSGWRV